MKNNMQDQMNQQQPDFSTSTNTATEAKVTPKSTDYIEFEEIKDPIKEKK